MKRLIWLLAVCTVYLSTSQGQYTQTLQPDLPHTWESQVIPPEPGEWLRNMPPGWTVPRDIPNHIVRAFYLVPSNRTAMPGAISRMRDYLLTMQSFYREQMERNGFGPKTIAFETEADGITPIIHLVDAPNIDSYYRADPWARVAPAAQAAGLPVWSSGQVWLGIFESHIMNADGSITGEFNGGSSWGSGSDAGLGITNSNTLALALMDRLTSDVAYNGAILPELGPYKMVYGTTAGASDGSLMGELASTRLGVVIHELSHGLGLPHDFRNDRNRYGNLLGNGFRGIRGWVIPESYNSQNEVRLGYGNALALSVSRYFNGYKIYSDNTKPSLSASSTTSGTVSKGNLVIPFSAQDSSGLTVATIQLEGNLVGEMQLSGNDVNAEFNTPFYETGSPNNYIVNVWDTQGNKRSQTISVTVPEGTNRAPRPYFTVTPSSAKVGEEIVLSSTYTLDPDHSYDSLLVQWDVDGDGLFDTTPQPWTPDGHSVSYATPGSRLIRMRVTDPAGAESISTPIAIKIVPDNAAVKNWGIYE